MNIAIIKAGGVGSRMGARIPKQFVCVDGKPVIIYTLEAFEQHPGIDAIVVVCLEGWHDILRTYAQKFKITKLTRIVNGGETSLKSIQAWSPGSHGDVWAGRYRVDSRRKSSDVITGYYF